MGCFMEEITVAKCALSTSNRLMCYAKITITGGFI
jgi:hypothetical protein